MVALFFILQNNFLYFNIRQPEQKHKNLIYTIRTCFFIGCLKRFKAI